MVEKVIMLMSMVKKGEQEWGGYFHCGQTREAVQDVADHTKELSGIFRLW